MLTKEKILEIAKTKGKIITKYISTAFKVSRQYASALISELVAEKKLIKIGSTRNSYYVLPEYAIKHHQITPLYYLKSFKNVGIEEHILLNDFEKNSSILSKLSENIRSVFIYAFSEILNNAIEHSLSKNLKIEVFIRDKNLTFVINDSGIGVFNNVMQKKHRGSQLEAIQDILKGKTTTMPRSHSGEGIFFTSKVADEFILDSYGYRLIVNNKLPDIFIEQTKKTKKGTKVSFEINTTSKRHLNDVFNKFSNIDDESDYGFDRTEILVKLYTIGGIHVSRSQARRILTGLEKFRVIVFDYAKVPMVGQAFADEIYRVFHNKYPQIKIEETNMSETVKFMIERAKTEARRNA